MIRRGRSSAATSSSSVFAPVNFAFGWSRRNASVHSVSRFQTATGKPCSSMLSARLRPIVPRPMTPNVLPLMPISPAPPTSACSNARSRVRTPSSSPMSDASVPSPSGTMRAAAVRRPVDARLEAGAPGRSASEIDRRVAGEPDAGAAGVGPSPFARPGESRSRRPRPAQPRLAASRRTAAPRSGSVAVDGQASGCRPRRGAPGADRRGARAPRASASARVQRRSVSAVRSKSVSARAHTASGSSTSSTRRSARFARPSSASTGPAAPPDHGRQARQPERRDRVVQIARRQARRSRSRSRSRARRAPCALPRR